MRSPKVVLAGLMLVVGLGNVGVTFVRSTIPLRLDGRVIDIEHLYEKERGVDDIFLVSIGAVRIHVDRAVAGRLHVGDRVTKRSWSRHMVVNGRRILLGPSRDLKGMLMTMPLLCLVGCVLLVRRRGPFSALAPAA